MPPTALLILFGDNDRVLDALAVIVILLSGLDLSCSRFDFSQRVPSVPELGALLFLSGSIPLIYGFLSNFGLSVDHFCEVVV